MSNDSEAAAAGRRAPDVLPSGARRTLLTLSLLAPPLGAQARVDASLAVGAGAATDARGARGGAASVTPAVALTPDPRVRLAASGTAIRFTREGGGSALAGAASLDARQPLGTRVAVALSGAASRTATSFGARYDAASLLPSIEARPIATRAFGLTLFAGLTLAGGATAVRVPGPTAGAAPTPLSGLGVTPGDSAGRVVRVARDGRGAVGGAVATLGRGPGALTVAFREARARFASDRVIDRALTAARVTGPVTLSASVGARRAPDERRDHGSVAASLAVRRGVALQAAAGTYPSDRVAGTLGGRFASLGLVLSGARVARPRADALPGAPAVPRGSVRLTVRAPEARAVEVAGDWSAWRPTPATRTPDGRWWADVRLPRGDYRYAFRVDGRWRVPDGAPSVDDGFGGRSAVLVVR